MNKDIIITSDSGCDLCDLPVLDIQTKMIHSYVVDEDDIQYKDRIDINNQKICEKIALGKTFKTSAPNMYDFISFFEVITKEHKYVIHLSIGSEISYSAYSNSKVAAEKINELLGERRIYVIDTKNASSGSMIVAFFLIDLLKKYDIDEAIRIVSENYIPKVVNKFIVPDPTGFIRSGRNKSELSKNEIWNIYKIKLMMNLGYKFQLEISSGKFKQSKLIKSSLKNMIQKFFQSALLSDKHLIDSEFIVIGKTFIDIDLDNICNGINKDYGFKNLIIHDIGNTLTAYGCKNIFNIAYLCK